MGAQFELSRTLLRVIEPRQALDSVILGGGMLLLTLLLLGAYWLLRV